ncbi:MAG: UDP-4-amino-4,6-dideoxy-N-acetyl-beta-L-altrosamine transaminase, partial [Promethearchaeota archaeon]
DDYEKVREVLESPFLTTGPFVKEFEKEFAEYVGAKYAVAVSNGTAALHLAAQALDVSQGSEVITTPMSFAATANCILYNSGTPVFSDITERGLIDPTLLSQKLTERTTGIIPVHYMGLPTDLEALSRIAKENDLFIIEDACHALGAKYDGHLIGGCKHSDLSVFSFHPVKHITTGEGGMITTNNEELYAKLRILRTHGITKDQSAFKTSHDEPWYQEMQYLGFNYRLTDIQAALGLSQLARIDKIVARRREIASEYMDFFDTLSEHVVTIPETEKEYNSYHLYVVKIKNPQKRRSFFDYLREKGIYCQVHYIPIYWHPYYRQNGFENVELPNAERFYKQIISLPMYPTLTYEELEFVKASVKSFFT